MAHYRKGQWQESIEALAKATELDADDEYTAVVGLFRAMVHWQLNEREAARRWYDEAIGLIEDRQQDKPDLPRYQAEAAALLGVEVADDKPKEKDTPETDQQESRR
jgi:tetratricopeptide (TPR) repeat protein